ncbi:MAG: twitching motility protein PilT [Lachnospiraceae bacterium]|nr:twitching motility protein PilT [Lachnospiraceae bacterium]MBQ6544114.1 twitching motility protein PilT [Lachnospiraceae bacterium]
MVHLIVGAKGKGKTKVMHDRVNTAVRDAKGSIVYVDKNSKHMFDLNNKIRLIDASAFPIRNSDQFIGFLCGIFSQDHDLEQLYLDGFLDCAKLTADSAESAVLEIERISEMFHIDVIISFSAAPDTLSPQLAEKVLVAL